MLQTPTRTRLVHVLVATPSGTAGQGGIDRIMGGLKGELERQHQNAAEVEFRATRGPGHIAFAPLYLAGFLGRMLLRKAMGRLDLVHINLASGGSTHRKLQVARLARLLGVPYILHLHGGDYPNFWADDGGHRSRSIRAMFAGAARIIVLGRVWREFVAGRAPESASRIVVIPNAAPRPDRPRRGGGATTNILFLGRIHDLKGVPELGEALHNLRDRPDWHATIAGDGFVDEARAKAVDYGLGERVDIPGWVDGERVAELLAEADILVLPSHTENLPLSIIEAMAAGVAVVATPVGAVPDVVRDEETGLLVPVGDPVALTAALRRLLDDKALRQRLAAAGQALHRQALDIEPFALAIRGVWLDAARPHGRRDLEQA